MTQKERVLEKLRTGEWFSTVNAVNMCILRLGAIIFDLNKEGHKIEARRTYGKTYSEYRLHSQQENKNTK